MIRRASAFALLLAAASAAASDQPPPAEPELQWSLGLGVNYQIGRRGFQAP